MQYTTLKELQHEKIGAQFQLIAKIDAVNVRKDKNGNDYYTVDFSDGTGSASSTVFSNSLVYTVMGNFTSGDVAILTGTVEFYNNTFRPKIGTINATTLEYAASMGVSLVPTSPRKLEHMIVEVSALTQEVQDPQLRKLVEAFLSERNPEVWEAFKTSTGAIRVHHAYLHGLIEHSVSVARIAKGMVDSTLNKYNRDLVIVGGLLHDIGKIKEYNTDITFSLSKEGLLLTHHVIGYTMVVEKAKELGIPQEVIDEVGHIILSHHGKLEHGAVVIPTTPEALIVHHADALDAHLNLMDDVVGRAAQGDDITEKVQFLGTSLLVKRGFTKNVTQ